MKPVALLLLSIIFGLSSCSKYYYAPALLRGDVSYLPKPASFDSVKNSVYILGGLGASMGVSAGKNSNEITFGTLDISAGHVFKSTNIAYGAFCYAGNIRDNNSFNDSNELYPLKSKSFSAIGGRFSANLFKNHRRTNFRYLGIDAVYSKELGNYADFRKLVDGKDEYYAITGTDLLSIGLTSEVLWRSRRTEYIQHSIKFFMGNRVLNNTFRDRDNTILRTYPIQIDMAYFMKYKKFFGCVNTNLSTTISLRLGYSIK